MRWLHHNRHLAVTGLAAMLLISHSAAGFDTTPSITTLYPGHKHLMLADGSVERAFNLEKRYHAAQRHGEPVLAPDEPWENNNVYVYGSVIHDRENDVYRMWYDSYKRDDDLSHRVLYAESENGYDWRRVRRGEQRDGVTTNIVPNIGGHNVSVVSLSKQNDGAPPYRFFWYQSGRIMTAISDDGISARDIHGTNFNYGSLPRREDGTLRGADVYNFSYDPLRQRYLGTFKCHKLAHAPDGSVHYRRAFIVGESRDGDQWIFHNSALRPDARDDALAIERAGGRVEGSRTELYGMPLFRYESLIIGLPWLFIINDDDESRAPSVTHLAWSVDGGYSWQRPATRRPFIPLEQEGVPTLGTSYTAASPPVRQGDRLLFYIARMPEADRVHAGLGPNHPPMSIGVATLRVDGFASLAADADGGWAQSPPLETPRNGLALHVNADAADGEIRIELLDFAGEPIEGFTADDFEPITDDYVEAEAHWNGRSIHEVNQDVVRLRFYLTDAQIYAYWVE